MRYLGGKYRIAQHIAGEILTRKGDRSAYLEPFLGGAAVLSRVSPHFSHVMAGDAHPDLIMMWQAIQSGWQPPDQVSREEWYRLKQAEPSALRGFVGFGCSFGGRWFEGYAHDKRGDDYCGAAKRSVMRQSLADVELACRDYRDWTITPSETVIYADPPYAGKKWFSGMPAWDAGLFWQWAEDQARAGAVVLVSEYTAPAGWVGIWSRQLNGSLHSHTNTFPVLEKLFAHEMMA